MPGIRHREDPIGPSLLSVCLGPTDWWKAPEEDQWVGHLWCPCRYLSVPEVLEASTKPLHVTCLWPRTVSTSSFLQGLPYRLSYLGTCIQSHFFTCFALGHMPWPSHKPGLPFAGAASLTAHRPPADSLTRSPGHWLGIWQPVFKEAVSLVYQGLIWFAEIAIFFFLSKKMEN